MPEGAAPPLELWRAFVPRWSYLPLSGEGAARFGERWNPVGVPTVYAARELSTAWAEYNQGFVQHPALIVRMRLNGAALADLTATAVLESLGIPAEIHECQWRDIVDAGGVPDTYTLRRKLLADGFDGVIYPSFMSPGGSCVALWKWNAAGAPTLDIIDPDSRLPKSPASWT